jgi:hypothetical protein
MTVSPSASAATCASSNASASRIVVDWKNPRRTGD